VVLDANLGEVDAKDVEVDAKDVEVDANLGEVNAKDRALCACLVLPDARRCEPVSKQARRRIGAVLAEARVALGMSQRRFGEALGSSQRTAARWDAGQSTPDLVSCRNLVPLLLPEHRDLAIEVAAWANDRVVEYGPGGPIEIPAAAPSGPTATTRLPLRETVDLVVLAAVEETGVLPATVRPLLHRALQRARELGLTLDALEAALRPASKKSASRAPA
jgi:transcriptional regulator with XRE-family HTH domain